MDDDCTASEAAARGVYHWSVALLNSPECGQDAGTAIVSGFYHNCVPTGHGDSVKVYCTGIDESTHVDVYSGSSCSQWIGGFEGSPGACATSNQASAIARCDVTATSALQELQRDLATYRSDSSSSGVSKTTLVAAIAGGVCGFIILATYFYYCWKDQSKQRVVPADQHREQPGAPEHASSIPIKISGGL